MKKEPGFFLKLKILFRHKTFWMGLGILILGAALNNISAIYLSRKYGNNLPILNDLILDNLPYFRVAWIYDLFIILSTLTFIIYALKKDYKSIPYYLGLFGAINLLRGFFIALTPFGTPNGKEIGLFRGSAFTEGVYPSGHTGSSFLAFLLAKGIYKKIIFTCMSVIIVALLFGRGHYSIDILSALIFAYVIYTLGEKYLKNKLTIKD